jgi:hypothetical protein
MVVVADQVADYFDYIAPSLVRDIRSKMRRYTGAEQEGIQVTVTRSPKRAGLTIRPTTVQGAIDDIGLPAGKVFPRYGFGSMLAAWVYEYWNPDSKRLEATSFLVARAIHRRGMPNPNDRLRRPFKSTREEWDAEIRTGVKNTLWKAALIINHGNTGGQ